MIFCDDGPEIYDENEVKLFDRTKKYMDHFGGLRLDEKSLWRLRSFIRYYSSNETHSAVSYNFIIMSEIAKHPSIFIDELQKIMGDIKEREIKKIVFSEEEAIQKSATIKRPDGTNLQGEFQHCITSGEYDIIIINDCISLEKFEKKREEKSFSEKYDIFKRLIEENKSCVNIFITTKDIAEKRYSRDERFYFSVLQHHLSIESYSIEEIYELFIDKMTKEKFILDEDFKTGIYDYIKLIYDKADRKNEVFIEDLRDRVLTLYFRDPHIDKTIDVTCIPSHNKPQDTEEVFKELDRLVGQKNVKAELHSLVNFSLFNGVNRSKLGLHMVFTGNSGTGKREVAKKTARILRGLGINTSNKFIEASVSDLISPRIGETASRTKQWCESAYGGVLFIKSANLLNQYDGYGLANECVDVLAREMEKNRDKLVIIFSMAPKFYEDFMEKNKLIESRIFKTIKFEDFSEEELIEIFNEEARKDEVTADSMLLEKVKIRLSEYRFSTGFGNAWAVKRVYNDCYASYKTRGLEDGKLIESDLILPDNLIRHGTVHEQLEKIVGLSELKNEVKRFEKFAIFLKKAEEKNMSIPSNNLHMLFMGNPGSGKTTIARIMARILYETGVLKVNKIVEVERKDLVGTHVGETAVKTNKVIMNALGGVLFIDEAYSLVSGSENDFGGEAITTIITAMENHKGELVVIFAGYETEMLKFVEFNPGIRSRIGYTFHFTDYNTDELMQIYERKMKDSGFSHEDEALKKIMCIFEYFKTAKDFGNGRFVDKVIQTVILRHAEKLDYDKIELIVADDIPTVKEFLTKTMEEDDFVELESIYEEDVKKVAVHEMGHALVSYILDGYVDIASISVDFSAGYGGKVVHKKHSEKGVYTESYYFNMLIKLLSGKNAEKVIFDGEHTSGCQGDFGKAKIIDKLMVEEYAMGDLGITKPGDFLMKADAESMRILRENSKNLTILYEKLLEKKEIDGNELSFMFSELNIKR